MSTRGISRERQVREGLERDGWVTVRAAGSLGVADIVALKQGAIPKMIEVKSTAKGPFEHFGPAKRDALISAAAKAGAIPCLVWWPAHKGPHWVHVSDWPAPPPAELELVA